VRRLPHGGTTHLAQESGVPARPASLAPKRLRFFFLLLLGGMLYACPLAVTVAPVRGSLAPYNKLAISTALSTPSRTPFAFLWHVPPCPCAHVRSSGVGSVVSNRRLNMN